VTQIGLSRIHEMLRAAYLVTRVLVIITAVTFHGNDLAEVADTRTGDDNDNVTEWDRHSSTGDP